MLETEYKATTPIVSATASTPLASAISNQYFQEIEVIIGIFT